MGRELKCDSAAQTAEVPVRQLTLLSIPLLLAWPEKAPAQGAQDSAAGQPVTPLCYRARPKPACSAFIVTNFGGYVVLGGDRLNDTPFREVADWGLMANVSARDALGASVFASLDRLGFALGPAVRYRRWLSSSASLDLAVGTPLVTGASNIQGGSVFGLVRWSPNDWFAVAARPELLRQPVFLGCGPTTCASGVQSRGRVSLGFEFGRVPGLALTAAASVATLLLAAAIAAAGN
jgi:hypothetical protein